MNNFSINFFYTKIRMTKLTWKEATLNYIKELVVDNKEPIDKKNANIFSIKQLSQSSLQYIVIDTKTRSKSPERNLDKTLRELKDYNILRHREDHGTRVYEYIPNHDNEELVYKDKRSTGHIRVTKCLERFGIRYEEEKTFKDLKHVSFLRFDIYCIILKRKIAIEYDGTQHQKAVDIWGGDTSLQDCKQRDDIKNKYCVENGITLLRISHEVKDIEGYVANFIWGTILEYVASCLLIVFLHLYQKYYHHINGYSNTIQKGSTKLSY